MVKPVTALTTSLCNTWRRLVLLTKVCVTVDIIP